MAEFRSIHSKMWRDSWFTELDVDGKLLWVYLITNSAASLTGIYYMTVKFASFETGLSQERVTTLLSQFTLAGKIEYENDVVWIRRMRKYQAANETSPKVSARILKDLAEIPDCKVKRLYMAQYPIDTVSIPVHTDTETDTETETDIIAAKDAASAKPRKKTAQQEALAVLENEFSSITAIPLPGRATDRQKMSASVGWWQPLTQIWQLENKDTTQSLALIHAAIEKMRRDSLTIAAPRSILKVAISIHGNGKSQSSEKPAKVYR